MDQAFQFGGAGRVTLEIADHARLDVFARPPADPLDDPVAAVAAAVSDPLDFPPLAWATVPGDEIVITVDDDVPQAPAAVAGIVHCLLQGGTSAGQIKVVERSASLPEHSPLALLAEGHRAVVTCEVHDPHDHSRLSYLAASQDGKPIYLNRTICDADVVIPVSAFHPDASPGSAGVHAGVFPAFSDRETQVRFQVHQGTDWEVEQSRRRTEADEAAWLLGAQFMVQIIPGPGDSVLHVLAGDAETVGRRARQLSETAWRFEAARRAPLVVATIEGGPQQQTWENLARALHAAQQVVEEHGAIVICSELARQPGPALQKLAGHATPEALSRDVQESPSGDAMPALLLADACQTSRVYLLSCLDEDTVESLGLAHVQQTEEVARLSRQFDACIVLQNAHRVITSASANARP